MNAVLSFAVPGAATNPLGAALQDLHNWKQSEDLARTKRLEAEDRVLLLMGELPIEGTTKTEADGIRCTVTTSLTRKLDSAALERVAHRIPEAIGKRVIRWKSEVDVRELRFVQANEPEIYAALAEAITAKPAKPSVKLDIIKEG